MASSPTHNSRLDNFLRSLSKEQREAYENLEVEDDAVRPAISHANSCQRNFDRLEREMKYLTMTNRISPLALAKTSHQQSYEIKFGLRNGARGAIDRMTNAEIVRSITRNKAPFDQVRACRVHPTSLVLMVSNPEAEAVLHGRQHEIGPMLNVRKEDCYLLRQTYQVQILNFRYRTNGQFNRPKDFIGTWGADNGVHIIDARWTYKKIIWTLDRLGDAQKLVSRGGVVLSGHMAQARAFDKRSTPKQCHTCGKPGHLKNQCPTPDDPVCLRCGLRTRAHNAWDGGCKGPECCINCGRNHPAWGPQCQDPKMRRALEESRFYAVRKVFWEHFPSVDFDPTTDAWPEAVETNSRKRQRAHVEEHFTSRAATPAHSDTQMDDYPSEFDSQEPFRSLDESHADESSLDTASSEVEAPSSAQPFLEPAQPDIPTPSMASTTSLPSLLETVSQHTPQPTLPETKSPTMAPSSAFPSSSEPFTQSMPPETMDDTTTPTSSPQRPSQPPTRIPCPVQFATPKLQRPARQIQQPNEFPDTPMGPKPRPIPSKPKTPSKDMALNYWNPAKHQGEKKTRIRMKGGNNTRRPKKQQPVPWHSTFHAFARETENSDYD